MNITELQSMIISLTNRNISQADISKALGVTPQTISKRIKTDSQITMAEINKINSYFKIDLLGRNPASSEEVKALVKSIEKSVTLSANEVEFLEAFFSAKNERVMAVIFRKAIYGDEDSIDICKRLLNNPQLASAFVD